LAFIRGSISSSYPNNQLLFFRLGGKSFWKIRRREAASPYRLLKVPRKVRDTASETLSLPDEEAVASISTTFDLRL
jgi:hypothetical protein